MPLIVPPSALRPRCHLPIINKQVLGINIDHAFSCHSPLNPTDPNRGQVEHMHLDEHIIEARWSFTLLPHLATLLTPTPTCRPQRQVHEATHHVARVVRGAA